MDILIGHLIRTAGWGLFVSVWLASIGIVMAATSETRPVGKTANPPATQSPLNQPAYPGTTAPGANVTPVPLPLKALRVQPYVAGGNNAVGTVELAQPLPYVQGAGGLNVSVPGVNVTLQSSNPDLVQVPSQVTVTSGTSANFFMTTRPVGDHTPVTITARVGAQAKQAALQVRAPWVESVAVNLPKICNSDEAKVSVRLVGPAPPGGTSVRIRWPTGSQLTGQGWDQKHFRVPAGQRTESIQLYLFARCQGYGSQQQCGKGVNAAAHTANGEFSLDPSTNAPVSGGDTCTMPQ